MIFLKRVTALAGVLVLAGGIAKSQPPGDSTDRASLEGTVVNAQNGRVVPRANVIVRNLKKLSSARSVRADSQGHFVVKNLEPGSYRLSAERQSYFSFGRHQAFQYRVDLSPGEQRANVVLSLQPAAVITGQITDENSDPLQHVQVQILDRVFRNGRLTLEVAGTTLSDDRGQYRISDVRPGAYYVLAEVQREVPAVTQATTRPGTGGETPPESDIAYSPVFFPDSADFPQAQALAVNAGDEALANFVLAARPSVFIRGRVVNGITGDPVVAAVGAFWTEYLEVSGIDARSSPGDGSFEVRGLAPGAYTLRAAFTKDGLAYTARRRVEVGPLGLENVVLDAVPYVAVNGVVHWEISDPNQRAPQRMEIAFQSTTSQAHAAATAVRRPGAATGLSELGFQTELHDGDQYTVSVRGLPGNFYLKSMKVDGRSTEQNQVTVSGQSAAIDLVINSEGGSIQGVVLDEAGQPVSASVVLVPEESKQSIPDLFRKVVSGNDGKFRMRGVPPGSYKLFAFDDVDVNELISQPGVLKKFDDRAVSVTAEEQTDYTTALKVTRAAQENSAAGP